MVTIVRPFDALGAAPAPGSDPWPPLAAAAGRWLEGHDLPAREAIVLLPFASLLPLARRAFAARTGWLPRIETTETLAASLGPAASAGEGPCFDVTLDRLVAARLLRSRREGASWERRDARGFDRAVRSMVATAHRLLRAAAAVPPSQRDAHWDAARLQLAPSTGPGGLERFLARLALEWAMLAPPPATDRLHGLAPAAWIVVRAGGAEPLAERLLASGRCPALVLDTDADPEAPFAAVDASAPPAFGVCDGFEHEAQATAAQIALHLRRGEAPVALVAQDRVLVRRVRALLERDAFALADETGWRLSTTRAAALVMALLRAARADAGADALLEWLKALPDRDARFAGSLDAFERRLRRDALTTAAAIGQRLAHDEPGSRDAGFWAAVERVRTEFAPAGRRPLVDWIAALRRALVASESLAALEADDAGRQVVAALRLGADRAADAALHGTTTTLAGFTDWVDAALEEESFRAGSDAAAASAQVVVTPLARVMLRPFAAVVLPGADDRHLGATAAPDTLLADAQARALGLPDAGQRRQAELLAFAQVLRAPRLTLLRRRVDAGDPLADSPLVARLALALAERGSRLAAWHDPRTERVVEPAPVCATAPAGVAALLPARLSATACEALRTCPYRFFASQLLRLDRQRELDGEIEKRDYGSWLHRVLHAFHTTRDAPGPADAETRRLLGLAEASRAHFGLAAADFVPFLASFEALAPEYVAWLHRRDAAGWRWTAGEEEVVLEPEGFDGIALHGRVDRLDTGPAGDARVTQLIDYKTGGVDGLRKRVREPFEDTQLAFYAALLAGRGPIEAVYLPLDGAGSLKPVPHPDPADSAEALLAGLAHDLRRVRGGAGLAALGAGDACRHCDARGVCRRDDWATVAAEPPS